MRTTQSDEEEEGDIADNPLLSAIAADLERAEKQTDNNLLVALAAIVSALFLIERLLGKNSWLEGLTVVAVIGAIGYTIFSVVLRKRDVATKYGLICPVCEHKPSAHMIIAAATTHRCRKCGAELNG